MLGASYSRVGERLLVKHLTTLESSSMAVKSYGDQLPQFCESAGLVKIRRLRYLENHFHMLDQKFVDDWISVQESELRDESISIARKALANSLLARKISFAAVLVSTATTIIIFVINYYTK